MHHFTDVSQAVCMQHMAAHVPAYVIDIFENLYNSYVIIILIVVDHQMISEGSIDKAVSSTDTS